MIGLAIAYFMSSRCCCRVAAIYNRNDTTTLADDFVEFYGYDQSWRLTTVWRQAAADENGDRSAPVIYERFLHNPGWGSRLDAPLMSQVNDNWDQVDELGDPIAPVWDGEGAHRRTFIQDTPWGRQRHRSRGGATTRSHAPPSASATVSWFNPRVDPSHGEWP